VIEQLPLHLSERSRLLSSQSANASGHHVMYWMRTAIRVDENPALDAAKHLAHRLNLPLLVYQGLSNGYRYASDRHHTFILQAARDVQDDLAAQGIEHALYVEIKKQHEPREPVLVQLANLASIIVTEDMPTQPSVGFLRSLKSQTTTPIIAVDTACVVPMQRVGKAYTRAFEFRDALHDEYESRVSQPWPKCEVAVDSANLIDLTTKLHAQAVTSPHVHFDRLDWWRTSDLVASCDIDHTIAPVSDSIGGSQAGYARWHDFLTRKIDDYARDRNDPLRDGSSRMSAYLHYGMVSPFRVAREATAQGSEGAEKFLDELLIWRELSYAFCFYRPDHGRWSAIPSWAAATLNQHASDQRKAIYSWEELARGQTHDELWNAAQLSLLQQGELHNNVRMTWGKAILQWTQHPREALQMMIDLNHRYALDGRDPSSYVGLLWCLGQFDRPFKPEQKVIGTVRPRPTNEHARRLDVDAYRESIVSRNNSMMKVAIIGAGLSGTIAARILHDHGIDVQIFEKSKSIGGRMATRRIGEAAFNHGAQYFTARDTRFKQYVESWMQQGLVRSWPGSIVAINQAGAFEPTPHLDRYIGTSGMTAIAKHLAKDISIQQETEIAAIKSVDGRYLLLEKQQRNHGPFDRVVVSAPSAQSGILLKGMMHQYDRDMGLTCSAIKMDPCWCVMIELDGLLDVEWTGAFVNVGPLRWISRASTILAGSNTRTERIVLHANGTWSQENLEGQPDQIVSWLEDAFWQATGLSRVRAVNLVAHRWRYSIPQTHYDDRCLMSKDSKLFACGDWAGGPKVEGAFLSGCAVAGRVMGTMMSDSFDPFESIEE
jgi:photolyase PhrII